MKMSVVKWDNSMAERCFARYKDGLSRMPLSPVGTKLHKAVLPKTPQEMVSSINIMAGEWDNFIHAISSTLKKKH